MLANLIGAEVAGYPVARAGEARLITIGLGRAGIPAKRADQAVIAEANRC